MGRVKGLRPGDFEMSYDGSVAGGVVKRNDLKVKRVIVGSYDE